MSDRHYQSSSTSSKKQNTFADGAEADARPGSVGTRELAVNAVTGDKIADGAVSWDKLDGALRALFEQLQGAISQWVHVPLSDPDDIPNFSPGGDPDDLPNSSPGGDPDDIPNFSPGGGDPDDLPNASPAIGENPVYAVASAPPLPAGAVTGTAQAHWSRTIAGASVSIAPAVLDAAKMAALRALRDLMRSHGPDDVQPILRVVQVLSEYLEPGLVYALQAEQAYRVSAEQILHQALGGLHLDVARYLPAAFAILDCAHAQPAEATNLVLAAACLGSKDFIEKAPDISSATEMLALAAHVDNGRTAEMLASMATMIHGGAELTLAPTPTRASMHVRAELLLSLSAPCVLALGSASAPPKPSRFMLIHPPMALVPNTAAETSIVLNREIADPGGHNLARTVRVWGCGYPQSAEGGHLGGHLSGQQGGQFAPHAHIHSMSLTARL